MNVSNYKICSLKHELYFAAEISNTFYAKRLVHDKN